MTDDELIERMAEAMWIRNGGGKGEWETAHPATRRQLERYARVALAVVREVEALK